MDMLGKSDFKILMVGDVFGEVNIVGDDNMKISMEELRIYILRITLHAGSQMIMTMFPF